MYDDESGSAPEADASVVSRAWDVLTSATEAVGDVAMAGVYATGAIAEAEVGAIGHIDAGIMDAVGADEVAAGIRDESNKVQDDAGSDWDRAGNALAEAGEDVFGS